MALQPSLQLVPIDVCMNLIKRKVSLSFWDQNISRFDADSHKSYINLCTFSGADIIRLSQPLTIKVETDDGRCEIDLMFDFHFQNIAQLVFYGDFMLMMLTSLQYYAYHKHTHNIIDNFHSWLASRMLVVNYVPMLMMMKCGTDIRVIHNMLA